MLFARCNIPTLRRALAEQATQRLAAHGIDVVEVEAVEDSVDLRRRIRYVLRATAFAREVAVFVYGLEHVLPRSDPAAPVLAELNMGRELFHRDAPYPIVFWLPDYAVTALARGAPDFWAWRSGVFEFESEAASRQEALQVYARGGGDWFVIDNLTARPPGRAWRGWRTRSPRLEAYMEYAIVLTKLRSKRMMFGFDRITHDADILGGKACIGGDTGVSQYRSGGHSTGVAICSLDCRGYRLRVR